MLTKSKIKTYKQQIQNTDIKITMDRKVKVVRVTLLHRKGAGLPSLSRL